MCYIISRIGSFEMNENNREQEKIIINKAKSNSYIGIVELPSMLEDSKKIKINITKKKYKDCIKNFRDVISAEAPNYNLTLFERNIKELCFKEQKLSKLNDGRFDNGGTRQGYLSLPENYIYLNKDDYLHIIFHELFHESSFIYTPDIVFCGFAQCSKTQKIGQALTEGYTSVLTKRYFNYEREGMYFYPVESLLVTMLEEIVGIEKMEELYSKADLYGLKKELVKYNTDQKTIDFIRNCDFISNTIYVCKEENNTKEIQRYLIFAISFLIETFCLKMKNEASNNEISIEEAKKTCVEFADFFDCSFAPLGVNYKFATKAVSEKMIVKIFPESNIIVQNEAQVVSKTKRLIQRFLNKK